MSLSNKDFYFLTNRTTFFRHFVDNTSGTPRKYIFYPQKYETMTDKQIHKYQFNLSLKFLWWSVWNKQKMLPYDYKVCMSKLFDFTFGILTTLAIARFGRKFLFRQQLIGFQRFMEQRNMDVKFWKAIAAYSFAFSIGYPSTKRMVDQPDLKDLAIQYSPNFTKQLTMPEIQPVLSKAYAHRYPWLFQKQA